MSSIEYFGFKDRKLIANTCEICDIHVNKEKITLLLSVLNSNRSVLEKKNGILFQRENVDGDALVFQGILMFLMVLLVPYLS